MRSSPLAAGLLAAMLCLAASRGGAEGIRGFALGVDAGGGVSLTESPNFPLKAQAFGSAQLLLEYPLAGFLGMGFSLGWHWVGPSDAAGGFVYRGHDGLEAGLHFSGRGQLAGGALDLFGGTRLGATVSFDAYSLSQLLFFYPSLALEPFLEFHFTRLGPHTFELGLPLQWHFRKDLDLSASLGLELGWRWYVGQKRKAG